MKCTTHDHGDWLWTPCMWIGLLLAAWILGSTYWYVCLIQKECDAPAYVAPVVTIPTTPTTVVKTNVATPDTTWREVTAKPLTVYFAANSDRVLTEGVSDKLANIVAYMQAHPNAKIVVTGHTNVHSSATYTDALGKTRAEKVKDLLVSQGAPAGSIATSSMGQRELVGNPRTAEGRYLNRRAVISVIQ
jgi:OmpA-OmpF porin, OOP family